MLKEELQLVQEPGWYVGEVVKVSGILTLFIVMVEVHFILEMLLYIFLFT